MSTLKNPTLFQPSIEKENNNVISVIHKKIASALREYNENIKWLQSQHQQGHIDSSLLRELNTSIMPTTHKTPIDLKLSELYIDPKFASIMAGEKITVPSAMVHLAAKFLTLKMLDKTDFPPICNNDLSDVGMIPNNS